MWSPPRSGSTWLLQMLSHPLSPWTKGVGNVLGFVTPESWQGTVDAIPVLTTYVGNHLLPTAGAENYTEDLVPLTFSSALGLGKRANYFFSSKYEDAWRPEVRRMMLVRFHRIVERAAARYDVRSPLVFLKEAGGGHAAPLVMSMFPRSRLLFLVRDGRDSVDSQTAANQPGGWLPMGGWATPEEREEFIRSRARTWAGDVSAIERAFEAHPPELRRDGSLRGPARRPRREPRPTCRVARPAAEANSGSRKRSRPMHSNPLLPRRRGPTKFFRSATPGAWRKSMTAEDAAVLESIMGTKLREFGYPVADGESVAGKSPGGDPMIVPRG